MIASACPAFCRWSLLALALWPPAAPSDCPSTEPFGFRVSEIELAHAFARVGEADAHGCTLTIGDFLTRHVRYAYRLFRHAYSFGSRGYANDIRRR
jgi:hypothetical protein